MALQLCLIFILFFAPTVFEAAADYYWSFEKKSGSKFYASSFIGQPITDVYFWSGPGVQLHTVPERKGSVIFCQNGSNGRCLFSTQSLPCLR